MLFNEGIYSIELYNISYTGEESVMQVSYGKYTVNGYDIILRDKTLNYKMYLEFFKEKLKLKNSFAVFNGLTFQLIKETPSSRNFRSGCDTSLKQLCYERHDYRKKQLSSFTFYYGIYKAGKIKLEIVASNKYRLLYFNTVLSEGHWSRAQNEIVLFDTSLKYPFYLLVGKNKLISKLLPGDCEGLELSR